MLYLQSKKIGLQKCKPIFNIMIYIPPAIHLSPLHPNL